MRLGEVLLDLGADLALPLGQLKGEPLVEGSEQPAPARAGLGAKHPQEGPAPGQHQLGDERLLEPVAPLGPLDLVPGVGRVDQVDRGARVGDVVLGADLGGQQLGDVVDDAAREAHGALDVPGVDALGLWVERVERAEGVDDTAVLALVAGRNAEEDHPSGW